MLTVRPARRDDAPSLVAILNGWIAGARTTAIAEPLDAATFAFWFIDGPEVLACHVALIGGATAGFQSISSHEMSPGWADIGTFVAPGCAQSGIGRALFAATDTAARRSGLRWINATVANDNEGGLAFYRRMRFAAYGAEPGWARTGRVPVGRVQMRYAIVPP